MTHRCQVGKGVVTEYLNGLDEYVQEYNTERSGPSEPAGTA